MRNSLLQPVASAVQYHSPFFLILYTQHSTCAPHRQTQIQPFPQKENIAYPEDKVYFGIILGLQKSGKGSAADSIYLLPSLPWCEYLTYIT